MYSTLHQSSFLIPLWNTLNINILQEKKLKKINATLMLWHFYFSGLPDLIVWMIFHSTKKMYSNNKMSLQYKVRKDRKTLLNWFCAFDLLFVWNTGYDVSLSNSRAMLAKMFTLELEGVGKAWAEHGRTAHSATDLDGRFAGDVGDQEVHGDVLTVYVLVHHVPDGLGHHVGV